jgi:multidrug efflux pump subunit AcrB
MFNITHYATRHSAVIRLMVAIILIGGIYSFSALGKREDSTFTIKSAVVVCPYPGATPEMVESLVLEPLERELRRLPYVDQITSEAHFGYGRIVVKLLATTPESECSDTWDELRGKCSDLSEQLPHEVGSIAILDDFGQVYGIYYALVADEGFTWQEMEEYSKGVEREIYAIEGVERITLSGVQSEEITLTISASTLAMFDLRPGEIAQAIEAQGIAPVLSSVEGDQMRIYIAESAPYDSLSEIENQLLTASGGKQYRLGDIMRVERTLRHPQSLVMRVDGERAIAIAISCKEREDVVAVGREIEATIAQLNARLPAGVELRAIYPEQEIALEATNTFLGNFAESLAIVLLLVVATMGWRSGVVVGSSLILSIAMTMLIMLPLGESLNRTSLAGFIIAMGMLVDNAIVVSDRTTMLMLRGIPRHVAVVEGARGPRRALLVSTLIAIASFLPLQLAPAEVAEIIRPLFVVIAISLTGSYLLAISQVPEANLHILREPRTTDAHNEPSAWYRPIVEMVVRYRWVVVTVAVLLFGLALVTLERMPQNFFPRLEKPMFRAELILPEGYSIEATEQRLGAMTEWLRNRDVVKQVSTTAGGTPPRYYLASPSYSGRANYGTLLVELHDSKNIESLEGEFREWVEATMPDVWLRSSLFKLSPVPEAEIEFGFVGEDIDTLSMLTERAMAVMRKRHDVSNIRSSWGNRIPRLGAEYSELKGERIGVARREWMEALEIATGGMTVGRLQDGDKELDIVLHSDILGEVGLQSIATIPTRSRGGAAYAIDQAAEGFDFRFVLGVIRRIDARRVMKAQCDTRPGANTIAVARELREDIEREVVLPEGYEMRLYGEWESREKSTRALGSKLPLTAAIIVILLVVLCGNYREPIIILVTMPLIVIGVVAGLGLSNRLFDFFSLLGLLGLVGMHVKSAVILIERIRELRLEGVATRSAVARAASERLRPVVTASGTTILALVPLVFDPMFGSMAATIMGGLAVATLVTMVVLPAVYTIFYSEDA